MVDLVGLAEVETKLVCALLGPDVLAVIRAMRTFRPCVPRRHTTIFTDHRTLVCLDQVKDTPYQLHQCALEIEADN